MITAFMGSLIIAVLLKRLAMNGQSFFVQNAFQSVIDAFQVILILLSMIT